MIISDEQLEKFKKICKERMGIEIDDERARDQAEKLLRLIELTRVPTSKELGD